MLFAFRLPYITSAFPKCSLIHVMGVKHSFLMKNCMIHVMRVKHSFLMKYCMIHVMCSKKKPVWFMWYGVKGTFVCVKNCFMWCGIKCSFSFSEKVHDLFHSRSLLMKNGIICVTVSSLAIQLFWKTAWFVRPSIKLCCTEFCDKLLDHGS